MINREKIVKFVLEEIGNFHFESIGQHLHPEAVMEWPFATEEMPSNLKGREAIISALSITPTIFKSFQIWPTAFYPCSDGVHQVVEAASAGEKVSGEQYANRYVLIFRFEGDQIALWREYLNPDQVKF